MWTVGPESNGFHLTQVLGGLNAKKEDQELVEQDAVVRLSKYAELSKGVDHNWNEHPNEENFIHPVIGLPGSHEGCGHLQYNGEKTNESKVHQHLNEGIVGHFTSVRMNTLKGLGVGNAHEPKTQQWFFG